MNLDTTNPIEKLDKSKRYKLACGHNTFGTMNVYPFKTLVCLKCGYKTERIEEEKALEMNKGLDSHLKASAKLGRLLEKVIPLDKQLEFELEEAIEEVIEGACRYREELILEECHNIIREVRKDHAGLPKLEARMRDLKQKYLNEEE